MRRHLRTLWRGLPERVQQALRRAGVGAKRPRWGNLRRTQPFSPFYGFERGLPVDRYYIEGFLERHRGDVRGSVLEVDNPAYTLRFGGPDTTSSDVLDIRPENERATIVADLGEPGSLPAGRFDCFILNQTLQLLPVVEDGLRNAWQSLAPGGVLLLSVPSIYRIDIENSEHDYARFTEPGLRAALSRSCDGAEFEVEGHGNLVAVVAALYGLATEELRATELDRFDPGYTLVLCARAVKPVA